ncbi:hypothetical protein GCM10027343_31890 [Noviherbaspirillum agri]
MWREADGVAVEGQAKRRVRARHGYSELSSKTQMSSRNRPGKIIAVACFPLRSKLYEVGHMSPCPRRLVRSVGERLFVSSLVKYRDCEHSLSNHTDTPTIPELMAVETSADARREAPNLFLDKRNSGVVTISKRSNIVSKATAMMSIQCTLVEFTQH